MICGDTLTYGSMYGWMGGPMSNHLNRINLDQIEIIQFWTFWTFFYILWTFLLKLPHIFTGLFFVFI